MGRTTKINSYTRVRKESRAAPPATGNASAAPGGAAVACWKIVGGA
jgi:hypothetical protein